MNDANKSIDSYVSNRAASRLGLKRWSCTTLGQERDMQNDSITVLYRYTTAERAINILISKRIFLPKPARFNDPFDCAIKFDPEITAEELIQSSFVSYRAEGHDWPSIKQILDQWIQADCTITKDKGEEMREVTREFTEKNAIMGVLSLSEDPLSPLMLAHYADHHRGACIGFYRTPENELGNDDITLPVLYSDIYPSVRFSEILKRDGSITRKLLFTKAKAWAYEREWRLFTDSGDDYKAIPGDIAEVILGCRIDKSLAETIRKTCAEQDIPVFQCEQVSDRFEYRRASV
jgi:hypothetical protein